MKVTVFGPNLSSAGQKKGDMHVHAADCADCKHYGPGKKFGGEDRGMLIEAHSLQDVTFDIYPPGEFDYAPEEWQDYAADFYVAPCVRFAS